MCWAGTENNWRASRVICPLPPDQTRPHGLFSATKSSPRRPPPLASRSAAEPSSSSLPGAEGRAPPPDLQQHQDSSTKQVCSSTAPGRSSNRVLDLHFSSTNLLATLRYACSLPSYALLLAAWTLSLSCFARICWHHCLLLPPELLVPKCSA
jgi:hypothetical protein